MSTIELILHRPPPEPKLSITKQLSNLSVIMIFSNLILLHFISIRKTKWRHLTLTKLLRILTVRGFQTLGSFNWCKSFPLVGLGARLCQYFGLWNTQIYLYLFVNLTFHDSGITCHQHIHNFWDSSLFPCFSNTFTRRKSISIFSCVSLVLYIFV